MWFKKFDIDMCGLNILIYSIEFNGFDVEFIKIFEVILRIWGVKSSVIKINYIEVMFKVLKINWCS